MSPVYDLFKRTLGLLSKYKLPPTPEHYSLWYVYASEQNPELNDAVDKTLASDDAISPASAGLLYQAHLADRRWRDAQALNDSLLALSNELSSTLSDSSNDAAQFHKQLRSRFQRLADIDEGGTALEHLLEEVRALVRDAKDMEGSTLFLQQRLSSAEQEVSKLRDALERSREDALVDVLTGLYNRRAFDMELAARHEPVSLILMDLDHFKNVNDSYGHVLGDQVLKATARKLAEFAKHGVRAYRFGGEEFAIILPDNLAVARRRAETLRGLVEKVVVTDRRAGKKIGNITASFGVAHGKGGANAVQLVEEADRQLYEAKRLGRNRVMPMAI
ncbi:GGDEF domain-containing protein [Gallaecimonas sp. GXIMD1310]|uniref:GGDEF domain-containing protein n=1 Tax=Gallaecimonas sp. GXIMD1310 TaxID=3131926 RepID=UPI003249DF5B